MQQDTLKDKLIAWQPNPGPQTWALQKIEKEILFGGQRGGGKTDAGIVFMGEPVQKFDKYRGLVLRRNYTDLSDWIARAERLYYNLGGKLVGDTVRFPSKAAILTGHLAQPDAYEKYQGHEYQRELIEELTHIPSEELFLKVLGSNRSTVDGLKPQFFGTTNPGGAGHRWVKRRFVDTAQLYDREYIDSTGKKVIVKHGRRWIDPKNPLLTRIFVPSRVEDNPFLFLNDPAYVAYLDSLPEELRQAWRNGSWDVYETKGAYFSKELARMRNDGRITKVPFDPAALVHTWWDLGNPENCAVGFFQQAGLEWHMIDFYIGGSGGIANYVSMLNDKKKKYGYEYGEHWAPHDIEVKEFTTGVTRIETARKLGVKFKVVPKYGFDDGIDAARNMFPRVWVDEVKCEYFIDAIANYKQKYNQSLNQYESDPVHDWASHPADMFRYFAVTNRKPIVKQSLLAQRKQQEASEEPFDKYSLFK